MQMRHSYLVICLLLFCVHSRVFVPLCVALRDAHASAASHIPDSAASITIGGIDARRMVIRTKFVFSVIGSTIAGIVLRNLLPNHALTPVSPILANVTR